MDDKYLVEMALLRYFNVRYNKGITSLLEDEEFILNYKDIEITVECKYLKEIDFFITNYLKYSQDVLDTGVFLTDIVGDFIDEISEIKAKREDLLARLLLEELSR